MCPKHCSCAIQLLCAACWKAAANCTVVEKECSDSGQKPNSPRKCCVLSNVEAEQANLLYLAVSRDTSDGLMPRQKPEFCFSSSKGQKAWINHWYRSWNPEESVVFQTLNRVAFKEHWCLHTHTLKTTRKKNSSFNISCSCNSALCYSSSFIFLVFIKWGWLMCYCDALFSEMWPTETASTPVPWMFNIKKECSDRQWGSHYTPL